VKQREEGRWQFALRALQARNFRLFFAGQSVSLIGTWMTRVATSWLVYRLTKSPFLLGIVSFAGQIPLFFLAPIAGVWVDRSNRHRMLIITQVLSMVQSLLLAALALTGVITIWHLAVLMLFQGFINALDMPVRQSFLVQMVNNRDELPNAIALNSSMVNAARLVGPAIAGVIIGSVGEGYCFLIDGISYLAVIVSLLAMHVSPQPERTGKKNSLEEMKEGWRYVSGSESIRSILLLLALISSLGMPYTVLMPIFAGQILHGGPHTLGYLMAAIGVGAFVGAVGLAIRKTVLGLGRVIPLSAGILGAALIGFAFSRSLWLSLALLLATGYGMMRNLAASNTLLQTILEEGKRGRVMSFYSMAFAGMSPFGSLLAGVAAARVGAPATVGASGVFCIAGAILFARALPRMREQIRPLYVQLGILPAAVNAESVSEVQTVSSRQ
jgi:MFS family permease